MAKLEPCPDCGHAKHTGLCGVGYIIGRILLKCDCEANDGEA